MPQCHYKSSSSEIVSNNLPFLLKVRALYVVFHALFDIHFKVAKFLLFTCTELVLGFVLVLVDQQLMPSMTIYQYQNPELSSNLSVCCVHSTSAASTRTACSLQPFAGLIHGMIIIANFAILRVLTSLTWQ